VFLGYVEAAIGLTLLALLISFIPTLYSAFQDASSRVATLVRAGIPATPWGVLEIAQSVAELPGARRAVARVGASVHQVGETHSTLTILNYYRFPEPRSD